MRSVLHVLATITLAPYFLLAAGFVLLGQAISSGSLWSFFDTLLMQATWLIPWGMIGLAAFFLILAALGLHSRSRWIAGVLLFLIAFASIAILIMMDRSPLDAGALLFLSPCVAAAVFGAWLAIVERRAARVSHTST